MPKPKRKNIGFSVAQVARMESETDKYFEWGRAVDCLMIQFKSRSDARFHQHRGDPKVWYRKEAAARKRLILRLAAMIEEMDV